MDPVTSTITIGRPREEVFDYLADIANHPEFCDHYLTDWRLTRVDSVGKGAGARFRRDKRLDRFGWEDMTFIEVERPYRIVAAGRGGSSTATRPTRPGRCRPPAAARGSSTPPRASRKLPTDRLMEAFGIRRFFKRGGRKALERLQSILEEDHDRGRRVTVAGV